MPFRYGISLAALVLVLHWTVSQSVFVVKSIAHYSDGSEDVGSLVTVAAYSPEGIIICKLPFESHFRELLSFLVPEFVLSHHTVVRLLSRFAPTVSRVSTAAFARASWRIEHRT